MGIRLEACFFCSLTRGSWAWRALKALVIFLVFLGVGWAGHASGVLLDGGPVITRDTQNEHLERPFGVPIGR